ncbi:MAG TPA: FtsX-like permease family protein [Bryobacteraceae bacterium]|jgi:putative ABC transport system permease protein
MKTALKIAWREARASRAKFLFVIVAVAAGVACLTGVKGFTRVFQTMLSKEARTLMAGDLMVRTFSIPTRDQQAMFDRLQQEGLRRTWITETVTMMSKSGDAPPVLISVKAVDPKVYPFYGAVKLDPPLSLEEALKSDTIAVSTDLLLRTEARIGDTVRIGGQPFRIAGTVQSEPDRMTGSLNVGPRVMMSRAALERAGILIPGSRASERFLFKAPPNMPIQRIRRRLQRVFDEALITDYTQTHPIVQNGLQRSSVFLSLVGLVALIVGSLGVGMAMQAHLQQKLDSIAIMKCIGGRSNQIIRIYALQTLGLGLAGGLIGVALGGGVQMMFPALIRRYFAVQASWTVDWISALQGILIGLLTTMLFTLPPLLSVRQVRPALIFRREMGETRRTIQQWFLDMQPSIAAGGVIVIGIGAIAAWLSQSVRMGVYFAGALIVSLAALSGVAWGLLRGLRWMRERLPRVMRKVPGGAEIRHGLANLYRPGNHAGAVLVAMGVGVMFTLTVYLVQRGLVSEMSKSAPPGLPNVYLIDITPAQHDAVMQLLKSQPGIAEAPDTIGTVAARIVTIDGAPLNRDELKGFARRYLRTAVVTSMGDKPSYTQVTEGRWWTGRPAQPELAVADEAARALGMHVGSKVEWSTPSRRFTSTVVAIQKTESVRLNARVEFVFSPGVLDGLPTIYYASVRVKPDLVGQLQTVLYRRFPTITVVNVADVLRIIQDVVNQIAVVVRLISAFALLAGAIILASSVAGQRFRRIREVVVLKTLGATRSSIAGVFSVEFIILGIVAGLMGAIMASIFAALVLKRMMNATPEINWIAGLASIVLTALIAVAAGWMASFQVLGRKPLEILREE